MNLEHQRRSIRTDVVVGAGNHGCVFARAAQKRKVDLQILDHFPGVDVEFIQNRTEHLGSGSQ
jgi:hypothetical protein